MGVRSFTRPNVSSEPASPSLFLQLPVDILLYLFRAHLQPEPVSAVALSLTCRDLFCLVYPTANLNLRLDGVARETFQLLLEKDLGHQLWYCHGCSILHPISVSGPTVDWSYKPKYVWRWISRPGHDCLVLPDSGFRVDYQSLRLAMNRHFLGPPNGLPLENFKVAAVSCHPLYWGEQWSARIIKDELFLSCTRTLRPPVSWGEEALQDAVGCYGYVICRHVRAEKKAIWPVEALLPSADGLLVPCRDVVESCPWCLTDYATTIERRVEEVRERRDGRWTCRTRRHWVLTITSYHRLGSGRSPYDVTWEVFTTPSLIQFRNNTVYPQGAIKAAWEEGDGVPARAQRE